MDFWSSIKNLEGCTLKTLDRGNRFQVLAVFDSGVMIKPGSTGKERLVPKKEIEGAYRELMAIGQISRNQIEATHSPRNPVYVASILAALPNVHHSIKPIQLQFRKL